MRYFILCMAVLLCIAPVSAGLFDFLNGPATGIDWDKTTIEDHLKTIPVDDLATRQERINQGIAAKVNKIGMPVQVSITKNNPLAVNLSPRGDYYIRLDSIQYEPATGMLKTYIYATRNGYELDIRNPVRFYGMGYTYSPDPGSAKPDLENPRLALLTSIYSYLQTLEYGKVINDGNDPTQVVYPTYDGGPYLYNDGGMAHNLFNANASGTHNGVNDPRVNLIGHASNVNRYTTMTRAEFIFNLSTKLYCNYTVTEGNFYYYIYNTSTINDLYYYSSRYSATYRGWSKTTTGSSLYDYNNFLSQYIAYNNSETNVTGLSTKMNFAYYPFVDATLRKSTYDDWFTILIRGSFDSSTPNRWAYGKTQGYRIYSVSYAGTAYDPFIVYTYTVNDICPTSTTCPTSTICPDVPVPSEEIFTPGILSGMFLTIDNILGGSLSGIFLTLDNQIFLLIPVIILIFLLFIRRR